MSQKRIMYAPFNFSWVVPDKLACMGWPQNAANLRFIAKEGITHLITLSMERKPPIDDLPKGMKWSQIYIEEFEAPTVKEINQFIDICQRAHFTKDVIGVHCRQGRGRTGVMAACYLVRFQDFTPEMAIIQLRVMRPGSVETYKQERAVVKYYDALRGIREERRRELAELPELPERTTAVELGLSRWKMPVHISMLHRYTNSEKPIKKIPNSLPSYVCKMYSDNY